MDTPKVTQLAPPILELGKQKHERKTLLPAATLLTLLLSFATLFFGRYTFIIDVKVDGEVVGAVADTDVLETLIDTTSESVETVLGREYQVAERVTYTLRLASTTVAADLDIQPVEHNIFSHIDGVDMHYAVKIDGEVAAYVPSIAYFQTVKDDHLDALIDDGALSAEFLPDMDFGAELELVDSGDEMIVDDFDAFIETLPVETVEHHTYREPVPFLVTIIYDNERFEDEHELIQTGMDGETEILARVTYIDGQEVQHQILQTKVVTEALSEIHVVGTLERPRTASFGEYIWPAAGTVTSLFGPRRVVIGSSNHQGIDIAAPHGTPIIAADGGEVFFVGASGGFGNLIKIRHDNGHVTYYAHLSSMAVSVGERVYRGQFLGGMGMTGTASGVHLHFEIRIDGVPVDPLPFLP
ncbi:MAG: peptidoglycan DD-metalloendopeptidase family protein [Oscillospiraceae bacterium]|nr:peptidoglycan DD-metalloendopeptidase family protein [Oscillospiraceae bacterium]